MLSRLLAFEIKLQTRQVGFWVTCLVLFVLGALLTGTDTFSLGANGGDRVKVNGAIAVAKSIDGISQLTLFFAAVFTVTGVMRDEEHKFTEIVHATPVRTLDMVLSRMTGVFLVTFLCVLMGVLGMLIGQFLPWSDKATFGAFNPLFYLQPIVLFLGINALLVSSIFMAVAAITRNKSLVYVSAIALFMLSIAAGMFLGENSPEFIVSLADPFGSSALETITKYWAPNELNENMMPLYGLIGLNRLVWLSVSIVIFFITLMMFERGILQARTKRGDGQVATELQLVKITTSVPKFGIHSDFIAFVARVKLEYMTIVKSLPFILLTLFAIVQFVIVIYYSALFLPDPTLPTSAAMVQIVLMSFGLSMLIITVFFGSDIIWRERFVKIHEILDATPVKNAVLVTSKWTALCAVILTLVMFGIIVGIAAQLILGDIPVNPWTYLKIGLFAFALGMLVDAVAVMFLQNFLPGRVIGMLVAGGVFMAFEFLSLTSFYHPLMSYGTGVDPGAYSEINGFNGLTNMRVWSAYWGGLILIFLVLSIWLLRRGTQTSLASRFMGMRAQVGPMTSFIAAIGMISFIGFGAFIFQRLNIDQEYRNAKALEKYQVKHEQEMKALTKLALPKIRSVEVKVAFKPTKQEAVVSGRYRIENVTGQALETLYISMASSHEEDNLALSVAGAQADLNADDARRLADMQLRRFIFNPPLSAGDYSTIDFETYFHPPRFGDDSAILKNGTFVNNAKVMPQLGVQSGFLTDPDKRRKYDLPKRDKLPDRDDLAARRVNFFGPSADYVDFKATLCTDKSQIALAPGTLLKRYEKNGQACSDFESNRPILNFFAFVSQDFEQQSDTWKGANGQSVEIAIYYHKTHQYNVPLMIKAAKASLDLYTQEYGPYLYEQVRIMEFPYGAFAQAFAGTIPFSENIGFVQDSGKPSDPTSVDFATYATMHEIAHQWFGHQIVPAKVQGFNVLSEGLSENAAMSAYEREFGWAKARRILKQRAIEVYLTGRTADSENELPLAVQEGKSYQDYAKANWVFWGLRHTVGEHKVNVAMKNLINDFGSKGPPYPTTLQVVDYLKAAVEPAYHQLISDYWDRTTFWDLSYGNGDIAVLEKSDGTFNVSFDLAIDKRVTPEDGSPELSVSELTDVTLNELVEVGYYTKNPTDAMGGDWFAKQRIRVTMKDSTVSFDLTERPTHVLLDPQRLLLERNHVDNLKTVPAK